MFSSVSGVQSPRPSPRNGVGGVGLNEERASLREQTIEGCEASDGVRVPDGSPHKGGYFDRITVLIVFAVKHLIFGVFLTF